MDKKGTLLFLMVLSIVAWSRNARADSIFDPTITLKGTATGTASKGPSTSDADLKNAQDHAKQYDGPTEFQADYTIVLKPDNTLDNGTVTFTTVSYTSGKTATASNFKTRPIKITGVTLNGDGSVATFTFDSPTWYPADGEGADGIDDKGLSGMINLKTGDSTYTTSYGSKSTGAVYKYVITGKIDAPAPAPPPKCDDCDEIFTPFDEDDEQPDADNVPESTSILLLSIAIGGLAVSMKKLKQ